MRASNPMERAVRHEPRRRAVEVEAFPEASPERLVGAVLVETHDRRAADTEAHLERERQDARSRRR